MSEQVTGQTLLDSLKIQLGAMANAYTVDQQLYFLNLGKDEVWSVVRSLDLDYFAASSQDNQPSQDSIFVDLNTAQREYDLPSNCRELRAIECLSVGFEDRVFEYRKLEDPLFQQSRREATASGANTGTNFSGIFNRYYYTVFGTQMMLAQFPEGALKVKLWYIKSLDAVTVDAVPEILSPFNAKIVDYAAKKAILAAQNLEMSMAWKSEWSEAVKTLAMTVGQRSSTNVILISDYMGG